MGRNEGEGQFMSEIFEPGPREFDSGEGAFHIFKHAGRAGWGGPLLLLVLYVVGYALIYGLFVWGVAPFFAQMPNWANTEPEAAEVFATFGRLWAVMPVGLLLVWALYAMIDAALLRWCFGHGAKIRFGGIELRLMLVELMIYALMAVIWIPTFALFALGAAQSSFILMIIGGISVFIALGFMIALAVKFAPSAALTVHRGHFSFFRSWRMTKGFFWGLLGAFVIIYVIYLALSIAMQFASQPLMMMALGEDSGLIAASQTGQMSEEESLQFVQAMFSADMLPLYIGLTLVGLVIYFVFQAAMAGVNAYAVKWAAAETPEAAGALNVAAPAAGEPDIHATSPARPDSVSGGEEGPASGAADDPSRPDEPKS